MSSEWRTGSVLTWRWTPGHREGREYLVFLMAFPALLLRSTRKTSTTIAITMTTATMAAMTPPAMAPALELLPVALSVVLPAEQKDLLSLSS